MPARRIRVAARLPRSQRRAIGRMRRLRRKVLGSKVHKFSETCQLASLPLLPGGAFSSGQITFKLNDLNNAPSFATLFDLYKLTAVKLKIIPTYNSSEATVANSSSQMGNLPVMYVAPNRDPFVPPPTSIADILNDDGCRVLRPTGPVTLWLKSPKPDIRDPVTGNAIPMQFNIGSKFQPWLTTGGNSQTVNQISTEHYGFRWGAVNQSGTDAILQVYATYYFMCKEQD